MSAKLQDAVVGGGALSLPWWVQGLAEWAQVAAVVLGALLVGIRLVLAARECWGRCGRCKTKGEGE